MRSGLEVSESEESPDVDEGRGLSRQVSITIIYEQKCNELIKQCVCLLQHEL